MVLLGAAGTDPTDPESVLAAWVLCWTGPVPADGLATGLTAGWPEAPLKPALLHAAADSPSSRTKTPKQRPVARRLQASASIAVLMDINPGSIQMFDEVEVSLSIGIGAERIERNDDNSNNYNDFSWLILD